MTKEELAEGFSKGRDAMTKVTDAEVEAAWSMLGKLCAATPVDSPDFQKVRHLVVVTKTDLHAALEAAEAERGRAESNLQKVQIPTSTLPEGHYPYCFETGGRIYTIPEGFIPWHGGECPVAEETRGEILLRSGTRRQDVNIGIGWRWSNDIGRFDIIAYRIHKPKNFRLEAGKFHVTASGERVGPMVEKDRRYGSGFSVGDTRLWDHYGKLVTGTGSLDHLSDILALSSNQIALQFITNEYSSERSAALDGDPLAHQARPIRDALLAAMYGEGGEHRPLPTEGN